MVEKKRKRRKKEEDKKKKIQVWNSCLELMFGALVWKLCVWIMYENLFLSKLCTKFLL